MKTSLFRIVEKRFAAVATAVFVPSIGLWLTYWERDHADREVKQKKYEYAVKQHDDFVHAIGEPLLNGNFDYLKDWEALEKRDYLELIESEASRIHGALASSHDGSEGSKEPRPIDKPVLSRLYGSRLALVLEAARITGETNKTSTPQKQIAKELLHFLRSNRLLGYGGLLSYFSDSEFSELDLSGVNLSCTNLDVAIRKTSLRKANLAGVFFSRSTQDDIIDSSNLSESRLAWARLEAKKIIKVDFSRSNMQLTSLSHSSLENSTFENAD